MLCNGHVLFLMLATFATRALSRLVPDVSLSKFGHSLKVNLVYDNKSCNYNLEARGPFALGAKIIVHTEQGSEQRLPPAPRVFASREPGMWATAILDDSTDVSRLQSGLFVCENMLIDIDAASERGSSANSTVTPLPLAIGGESSFSSHPRRMLRGRKLFEIANESDDWEEPDPDAEDMSKKGWFDWFSSSSKWDGEKWFPGCYANDDQPHVFKVAIVADVAAAKRHGKKLNGLIESTVAKASMVFESQLNIQLQISELQVYTSESTAPDYAGKDCPDIGDQLNRLTSGAHLSGGVVHLLTGCGKSFLGQSSGTIGLAYMGSMCSDTHNTGVTQLHGKMSWVTFAHEIGHNFGGDHTFEEGQGSTGGIMDYGDGKLDGEYQFHTKYRKAEMCKLINARKRKCGKNFKQDDWLMSGSILTQPSLLSLVALMALRLTSGQ